MFQKNRVLINGKKLKARRELSFGDFLSLEETFTKVAICLWFKERVIIPDSFIHNQFRQEFFHVEEKVVNNEGGYTFNKNPSILSACQNDLIISRILSHLPLKDLRKTHLVSRLWNRESNKLISQRGFVHFYCDTSNSLQFIRYLRDMSHNPLPNWNISTPNLTLCLDSKGWIQKLTCGLDLSHPKLESKWISDLDWFLSAKTHNVAKLCIHGQLKSEREFHLRMNLLEKLQSTLEVLELTGEYTLDEGSLNFKFPEELKLSKLRRFSLSNRVISEPPIHFPTLRSWLGWVTPLIQSVQEVRELHVKCDPLVGEQFVSRLNSFPNLDHLSLFCTPPTVLKLLLELDKPLKGLKLNELIDLHPENVHCFEELLAKHCKTLENLKFYPITRREETKPATVTVKMPSFPKLKVLVVGRCVDEEKDDNHAEIPLILNFVHGEPSQGIGIIQYERDFPILQSLSVHPLDFSELDEASDTNVTEYWRKHEGFFANFFPHLDQDDDGQVSGPQQICKSLVVLDIPATNGAFPRAAELAKMFPSVSNEWINKV